MIVRKRPTRRDLLLVITQLQGWVGEAAALHGNDRDPNGFERGQAALRRAFALCVEARSFDPPLQARKRNARGWP